MKNIILILITICSLQAVNSQNIDQATISKIRVKLISAEKFYEQEEYFDVIEKIDEIEALSKGFKSPKAQNLKVKAYIGWEMYKLAKRQLDLLYGMNPNEEIMNDIASYEFRIDEGIEEEKKEREKQQQLAKEKKEKEIDEALNHFHKETCRKCSGKGYFIENDEESCNYYNNYTNIGYWYCKGRGRIVDRGITYYCKKCKGKGTIGGDYKETCGDCDGHKYILTYKGTKSFQPYELNDMIEKNRSKILSRIRVREN